MLKVEVALALYYEAYTWVIRDKLAISPMPRSDRIGELAKEFTGVVVLVEPGEVPSGIDRYLREWTRNGVRVYYAPTPDFHPVDLLELYRITMWIDREAAAGGRVLVHCMGGIGRSGMVAAAYLVYLGRELYSAVKRIRSLRPGAVEALGQLYVLEDYYTLLRTVEKRELYRHFKKASSYGFGRGLKHASKTLQLIIELTDRLNPAGLNLGALYISALYHCLKAEDVRKITSSEEISEELRRVLTEYTSGDYSGLEALLLKIGHELDSTMDSRVVVLDADRYGERTTITLYCDYDCSINRSCVKPYIDALSKHIGENIEVIEQPYI
ncbi:MAG: hypothetical protein DRO13_06660 [Thermoprotei archaeon]|nr:MAG: hypothetical protein DRO13_06660 [Thermoprotei archaeon]